MTLGNAADTPARNNLRMNDDHDTRTPLNRRRLLGASLGGIATASIALATDANAAARRSTTIPLTAQATEGPYYFDAKQLDRKSVV